MIIWSGGGLSSGWWMHTKQGGRNWSCNPAGWPRSVWGSLING